MNSQKKLIIWILITNFLIIIAAGHGIATLGLMEVFVVGSLFNHSISKPIEEILLLLLSTAATFIGQITLIISFYTNAVFSQRLRFIGASTLLIGYIFLLANFWNESTIGISLSTGIPFIILLIVLFFKKF